MSLDLNCDLGEGESPARTRALMRWITSANVACGGHAGNIRSMEFCVRLAGRSGIRLGAHPGPWSRADFGRGAVNLDPGALEELLVRQVSVLDTIARAEGIRLHHIKLHGGLYHACENDPNLARIYVRAVRRWWPRCVVFARSEGGVVRAARRAGVSVWQEVFGDRAYQDDGTLVPRSEARALLSDRAEVLARFKMLRDQRQIETISGARLRLSADTVCLHSDTRDAPRLARALRQALGIRARGRPGSVR